MRYVAMIGIGLLLAGCVSYADIQARPPVHEGKTSKTPDQVANCVLPKWMESSASTHIVPDGDARVIVVPSNAELITMTLTASPSGAVAMRTQPSMSTFDKQWEQAQTCL